MTSYHALFATAQMPDGETITFRVGQPARSYPTALARWTRLWAAGAIDHGQRNPLARARVRYARRWYRVMFMEVRATDKHGRGLGRPDHLHCIPVPFRAAQRIR